MVLRGKFRTSTEFTKKGRKLCVVKNLEKNRVNNKQVEVKQKKDMSRKNYIEIFLK